MIFLLLCVQLNWSHTEEYTKGSSCNLRNTARILVPGEYVSSKLKIYTFEKLKKRKYYLPNNSIAVFKRGRIEVI